MADSYFPFHKLGYRSNPFRTLNPAEWAEVAVLPEAVQAAAAGEAHLQFVGERGYGKTSLLLGLQAGFAANGLRTAYERLPEGQRRWKTNTAGLDVFLLDEAQRLHPRWQRRLLNVATEHRLIVGNHTDFTPLFAAQGLDLLTVYLEALDFDHFGLVIQQRLDHFVYGSGPRVTISVGALCDLREHCGSNIRAAELILYEVFQSLETVQEITPDLLSRFMVK